MTRTRGPWTVHASRTGYENPWMEVVEHDVIHPDGSLGIYGVMSPKQWAIAVLPIDAGGNVTLVGQYRFALDRYSWEIPEGGGRKDGDPQACAARELREETGLTAACWTSLGEMDLSNSITDERAICFLATDLTAGEPDPDPTEVLSVRTIPFLEALDEVMRGDVEDALTVALLLRAYYMAREGRLEPALARAMLKH